MSGPSGALRLGLLQGSKKRRKSTSAPPEPKGTPSRYAGSAPCEYPTSTLRVRTLFEPKGHAQPVRRLACVGTDACAPNDSARLGSAVNGCRSARIDRCSPPDARQGAAVAVPLTQAHAALGAAAAATNPSRRKSRAKPRRSEVAAAIRTRKSHLLRPFPPAHALGLGESGWLANAM